MKREYIVIIDGWDMKHTYMKTFYADNLEEAVQLIESAKDGRYKGLVHKLSVYVRCDTSMFAGDGAETEEELTVRPSLGTGW